MPTITRDQISTLVPWDTRIPWHADHTDEATMLREAIAPYAALVANFAETTGAASGILPSDAPALTADPIRFPASFPRFVAWLRERNPSSSLIPAVEVPADTRQSTANAIATMRRREADAKRDAHQARQDLIAARVALAEAEERARNLEDASRRPSYGIDGTFVSEDAKREHFLNYARQATLHGNCSEYDRHVEESGVIYTRDWFRDHGYSLSVHEEVTYEVTVTFTYSETLEAGEDWDPSEWDVVQALRAAGVDSFDVNEISRDETE